MSDKKYIDNNPQKGLDYDIKKVYKRFKKLNCPKDVYDPMKLPFNKAKTFVMLSERSTGKTTNLLLLGMCFHEEYGTVIQYIRSKEDMIMNKNIKDLMSVIISYKYVEKLTDGRWNTCIYKSRRWYYAKQDENMDIIETCGEPFMVCLSIDKSEVYKSSYNAPLGDFIIFDEFIGKFYPLNEFVYFYDLVKTIIRDRLSPFIFLVANTIDKHSPYFDELEIYDDVQEMDIGENLVITSTGGTKVYVELIGSPKSKSVKKESNRLFFGFKNPMLNSITGESWAFSEYNHVTFEFTTILRRVYLKSHSRTLALDICKSEKGVLFVFVHNSSYTYDDSIIYTLGEIEDTRHRYRFGSGDGIDKLIWKLYSENKFYYQSNGCGGIISNYVKTARKATI